jgi:hypothetical protein
MYVGGGYDCSYVEVGSHNHRHRGRQDTPAPPPSPFPSSICPLGAGALLPLFIASPITYQNQLTLPGPMVPLPRPAFTPVQLVLS